jgi:predicted RNase H-like HicB family nuclease
MAETRDYIRIVQWSDEDGVFIGMCPELFEGGVHGDDPQEVYRELEEAIQGTIQMHLDDGDPLPPRMSASEFAEQVRPA